MKTLQQLKSEIIAQWIKLSNSDDCSSCKKQLTFLETAFDRIATTMRDECTVEERSIQGENCSCHLSAPCYSCIRVSEEDIERADIHNSVRAATLEKMDRFIGEIETGVCE